jgi:hypothetical protein
MWFGCVYAKIGKAGEIVKSARQRLKTNQLLKNNNHKAEKTFFLFKELFLCKAHPRALIHYL